MQAVHVRTYGMFCAKCPHKIEDLLAHVDGVIASLPVRSLELTSVLYDPSIVSAEAIAEAIQSAGFEAEIDRWQDETVGPRKKARVR